MAVQSGDENKIKCPHCKKMIRPPQIVKDVKPGNIMEVTGTCMLCGRENHFWARYSIRVDVEREDRVV